MYTIVEISGQWPQSELKNMAKPLIPKVMAMNIKAKAREKRAQRVFLTVWGVRAQEQRDKTEGSKKEQLGLDLEE